MCMANRTIHSLDLLGALRALPASAIERTIDFLMRCQDRVVGGFCGGPDQSPHLAPTYASVNAIVAMAHALEQEQPGAGHRTLAKINRYTSYSRFLFCYVVASSIHVLFLYSIVMVYINSYCR